MRFSLGGLVVVVRKPEIDDLAAIAGWLASDAWIDNIGGCRGLAPESYARRAEAMLQENADDTAPNKYFLVADRFTGRPLGLAMLCKIDWKNRHAEYAYIVGEAAYRTGIAAGDVNMVMYNYFFNELNLNKVYGFVFDTNAVSQRMSAFGGSRDGTLRRHRRQGGQVVDVHVFCLSRREFGSFVERYAGSLLRKHIERGLVQPVWSSC